MPHSSKLYTRERTRAIVSTMLVGACGRGYRLWLHALEGGQEGQVVGGKLLQCVCRYTCTLLLLSQLYIPPLGDIAKPQLNSVKLVYVPGS